MLGLPVFHLKFYMINKFCKTLLQDFKGQYNECMVKVHILEQIMQLLKSHKKLLTRAQ